MNNFEKSLFALFTIVINFANSIILYVILLAFKGGSLIQSITGLFLWLSLVIFQCNYTIKFVERYKL